MVNCLLTVVLCALSSGCCLLSLVCCFCSSLILSWACVFTKGWVLAFTVARVPVRPRIDGPRSHSNVRFVLSCPLWPCNQHMCVIAKETGLSPSARRCSKTYKFLRHVHASKRDQQLWRQMPLRHGCPRCVLQRVF